MKETFKFEIRYDSDETDQILKDALLALPECNPEKVTGFEAARAARARLGALKALVGEQEKNTAKAFAELRQSVARDWSGKEIPQETKAVLLVF